MVSSLALKAGLQALKHINKVHGEGRRKVSTTATADKTVSSSIKKKFENVFRKIKRANNDAKKAAASATVITLNLINAEENSEPRSCANVEIMAEEAKIIPALEVSQGSSQSSVRSTDHRSFVNLHNEVTDFSNAMNMIINYLQSTDKDDINDKDAGKDISDTEKTIDTEDGSPESTKVDPNEEALNKSTHFMWRTFFDESLAKEDWVPVCGFDEATFPGVCYLPTIIHENNKVLGKFLSAFLDEPTVAHYYKPLQDAKRAFCQLAILFQKDGLVDGVVEYLRPENHPNRIIERLQKLQTEYQELESAYGRSQAQLHEHTEKGAAEEIQGEERACITVRELEELEAECKEWKDTAEHLDYRLGELECQGKPLEIMVKAVKERLDFVEAQSTRVWERQDECCNFFAKHHSRGSAGAATILKMYDGLVEEHDELRKKFAAFPEQLGDLTATNLGLRQALKLAEKASSEKDDKIAELEKQLATVQEQVEWCKFDRECDQHEANKEIQRLASEVERVSYRNLLTPEQLEEDAIKSANQDIEYLQQMYNYECNRSYKLRAALTLAYQMGPSVGEVLRDAIRLENQRQPQPHSTYVPPMHWNYAFTGDEQHAVKEEAGSPSSQRSRFTDDPEIF